MLDRRPGSTDCPGAGMQKAESRCEAGEIRWSGDGNRRIRPSVEQCHRICTVRFSRGVAPSLYTVTYGKVGVKRGQCFQGSHAEVPPDWEIQADRAPFLGKCCACRMRPARRPGKCTVRARFFSFQDDFGEKCQFLAISGNSPSPEN